jgi:O-antigen/teichoic acid export membrane protein
VRTRRSILTFLSGGLSSAVILGVGFMATPLLLRWLGDERYGAFEAATDWFGYIALLELGVGGALRPLLALAWARRDKRELEILMAAGFRAYFFLTALMVSAGAALTMLIPRLLRLNAASVWDLRMGCLVGVGGLLVFPLAPFRALLEAEQKGYLINAALLVQSFLITACSLLLAWIGWGITGQFVGVFIGACAFNVAVSWAGARETGGLLLRHLRDVTLTAEWKAIWKLNWPTFAFNTCGQVGLVTDNIIIGALMSPALVVPFLITQRLAVLSQRQLQGIGNASWAALAELHEQGRREIFNQRLVELTKLVAIIAIAVLVPIVSYNRYFVMLWVGAARYGGGTLTLISAINAFLLAIFSLWGWCINGTGRVAEIMPGMIAQTVINLFLSLVLTLKFGLIGPVLGTLAGFVAVSSWYLPWLLHHLFQTSPWELTTAALLPMVSAIPLGVAVWWLSGVLPPRGWIELASEMLLAALLYLGSWWLIGLSAVEKDLWWRRAQALVPGGL